MQTKAFRPLLSPYRIKIAKLWKFAPFNRNFGGYYLAVLNCFNMPLFEKFLGF